MKCLKAIENMSEIMFNKNYDNPCEDDVIDFLRDEFMCLCYRCEDKVMYLEFEDNEEDPAYYGICGRCYVETKEFR